MDLNRFPPPIRPIRTNGNQLHMRFFIGIHSVALIPPGDVMQAYRSCICIMKNIYEICPFVRNVVFKYTVSKQSSSQIKFNDDFAFGRIFVNRNLHFFTT